MIKVAFTRPPERLGEAEAAVRKMGMEPFGAPSLIPVLAGAPVFGEAEALLSSGEAYFTVFASISAVEAACGYFGKESLLKLLSKTKVACTGPSTGKALEDMVGRKCDLVPAEYSGAGIASEIADRVGGRTVLILRSAEGDRKMAEMLRAAGADVADEGVYSMEPAQFSAAHSRMYSALGAEKLDAVLFTSPRSFLLFLEQAEGCLGKEKADASLGKIVKVAIGKPTESAMEKKGYAPDVFPRNSTFAGMLDAVREHFS